MTARCLALGAVGLLVLASVGPALGGEGVVALTTCDVSCPDDSSHFYVACGNGTVTDNRTGLVWLANADCFGQLSWFEAMAIVAGLGDLPAHACAGMEPEECDCSLSDHSSPGDWRLPSMAEWKAMLVSGSDSDVCGAAIPNDVGNGCWTEECAAETMCSFHAVQSSWYWSSSSYVSDPAYAWLSDLGSGLVYMQARESDAHVWPVRGGQ